MKELKYLNKYLFKYRVSLFLGILITIVARIFSLFAPRLIGNSLTAVERYILDDSLGLDVIKEELFWNIVIIISAALISGFLTFLMRQTIINVSRYIEFDLKNEIFEHYQKLCLSFYKNNRTGDLMNRISEDVGKVRMYFGPAIMYSINTIALFVIVISYMVSIAPLLTVYTLLPLPILSLAIYKLSKAINTRSTAVQETLSDLSTFTQESFSGIAVIKSYGIQSKINEDFTKLTALSKDKNVDLAKIQAWFFPLMILLIGFSNILVIFIGGNQYIEGTLEIGVLAEFIIYVNMLTWPVATVGWVTSIVQQAEASQKRINDFLKEEPKITSGSLDQTIEKGTIEFKNVNFTYKETQIQAAKNISFKLNPGETLGVIGKTGSGKSTLLDLISRLYDVDEGEILIDGIPIQDYNLSGIRSEIGYVPQNPFLFSETIERNIRFGKQDANFEEIKAAAQSAAVAENIERFKEGYETLLGERGVTLSGGQIQRISIARALIKDPKVLLFDDCLSAVDADTEEEILKNLKERSKEKTTLIVSHRISSVIDANCILVIDQGTVIEQGTHAELINKGGFYKELFQKQNTERHQ
ncbi:MAG: ABC transporter ATP-binding protein [Flavobacteriales bacterium]|jgi:ATP-binding cassette subfamily B multidrug efflux pump|tara:strand:- start:2350 stop:4104 length:1755 start_codon:yes stop_codon:yes gene_type:complete